MKPAIKCEQIISTAHKLTSLQAYNILQVDNKGPKSFPFALPWCEGWEVLTSTRGVHHEQCLWRAAHTGRDVGSSVRKCRPSGRKWKSTADNIINFVISLLWWADDGGPLSRGGSCSLMSSPINFEQLQPLLPEIILKSIFDAFLSES